MTPPPTPANAGNLRRWIEALESQDAPEQCYGVSHDGDKRCAVGVCHDVIESLPDAAIWPTVNGWLGIPLEALRTIMHEWNDQQKLTFPQIAAKIREWAAANGIDLSPEATG